MDSTSGLWDRCRRPAIAGVGDVSWCSPILDHCGERDGKPPCWKDTRWTGVLERRGGRCVILQMHFSFAKPPRAAETASNGGAG